MRRVLLLAVLAAAACGPRTADFPVGMFGVVTPTDIKVVSTMGFDAVQSYETEPSAVAVLAAAARKRDQLLLISPNAVQASTHAAREFPGVYWYLQDEPDVNHVSVEQLAGFQKKTMAWAPGAKTAFVVGDGHKAKDYPGVADVIMVDWYPVPHLPLESAGDHVRMTAEAAGGRKVWAVLQAFDWRDFPQHDPNKPRIGRIPTNDEMRFMAYDAVANGADGVWYFAYSTAPGCGMEAGLLFSVSVVAKELRAMAPIFGGGRKIPLPFAKLPEGLGARAWTYHGRDYAVLTSRKTGSDARVPDEMLEPAWRPLFVFRRDPREFLKKKADGYYLPEHEVMVLESRLRPKRFLGL